jgi:NAD(P)-dependent dehydrogenase (short-subunit alcohol dehydrogenase family)
MEDAVSELTGKVALVAGGTRGAGRGIAVELGAAGAHVYVTGRTTRDHQSEYGRRETIEETAEMVAAAGGTATPVAVDHLEPEQVADLVARIEAESGRLDILINDIWGGELLFEWNTKLWVHDLLKGLRLLSLAIDTHLITSHYALPLLVRRPGGLVVEMTDGTAEYNATNYRVSAFYDLAKSAVLRLAWAQGHELAEFGCIAVALTPGWLRSEMMLDNYGVIEDNWRDVLDRPFTPPYRTRVTSASQRHRGTPDGRWPRSLPTPTSPAGTRRRCRRASSLASTDSAMSTAARRMRGATSSRSKTSARPPTPSATDEPVSQSRTARRATQ